MDEDDATRRALARLTAGNATDADRAHLAAALDELAAARTAVAALARHGAARARLAALPPASPWGPTVDWSRAAIQWEELAAREALEEVARVHGAPETAPAVPLREQLARGAAAREG